MTAKRAKKQPDALDAATISEAIEYKLQGYSYEQIAEERKIKRAQAVELVHAGLATLIRDPTEKQLLLDLARIDQMLTAVYSSAAQGDTAAITAVLALRREREMLERRFDRAECFRKHALTFSADDLVYRED